MMAKSQNLATLVTLVVVATLLGHAAAATYIVGDNRGWTFDPNRTLYPTWASQHTFVVGDVLVFNFTTGSHTVATVTKASFDTCNISNPIALDRNGPANITLTSPGETHFICTIAQHCLNANQKLAINVTNSTTTSPPTSPPTVEEPTPAPVPETPSPTTYIVGDSRGWTFDPNRTIYPTWASQHNFTVGDTLVFNFTTGSHTVATVTKESFDTCNTSNTISVIRDGPARITLTTPGEVYFFCTVGQHCATASQKLAINVSDSTSSPPTTPAAPPPSTASRTGLASIFTIFISAAVYLLF